MMNYYDYSDPENMIAVYRSVEEIKKVAIEDYNAVSDLINFTNNINFMKDFSFGFDENERLKRLEEIKNEESTQEEINLFFHNRKELKN